MTVIKIRELNDSFRQTLIGGKVLITRGVSAMSEIDREILLNKVKAFNSFSEKNDPYKEHDFGCINFKGEQFFWKIDYYDVDYCCLSPDASDDSVTNRVLTIMCAEEF